MAFLKRITGLQMPYYNFTKYYVPADVKFEVYLKKKKNTFTVEFNTFNEQMYRLW